MKARTFAMILGVVFVFVGLIGFCPFFNRHHMDDTQDLIVTGPGTGHLLGLFHVNVLHNLVHLLFGVLGIAMARTGRAVLYCRIVAIAYGVLAVLGMIPTANIWHTFGLIPIEYHDVWLHALIALAAAVFGWMVNESATPDLGTA
jgi:hypothetical protein